MSPAPIAVVLCVVLLLSSQLANGASWWHPKSLATVSKTELFERLELLSNATILSYIGTHGSYAEAWAANATLAQPGWVRDFQLELNPEYGNHALVFVNESEKRVIVAFRGTDMDILHKSGQADQCADFYLWSMKPMSLAPSFCKYFSNTTLDYYASSRELSFRVSLKYPTYDILFTGHSLGAGLGEMLGAGSRNQGYCGPKNVAGSVVFSSPGMVLPLLQRSSVDIHTIETDRLVVFADRWDPVFVQSNNTAYGGMLGYRFIFTNGTEQAACTSCEQNPKSMNPLSPACYQCFMDRHDFIHYIGLIKQRVVPDRSGKPRNECAASSSCPPAVGHCL